MKHSFFILSLLCLLASCKEEADPFQADFGYEYFPLEVGKYLIYEVDSTIYDPTGDTAVFFSKTQVKEEIVDTLSDNLGNQLFKIERFERTADTLPWQVTKVFTASIQNNQAIRTEDNLRFIKMPFPLRDGASWNANIHFDPSLIVTVAGESIEMFKGWSSKIESVGEADTVGILQFPEVVTIRLADEENLIELRRGFEKYAKGIGLVYKELWILDTQCIEQCEGQPWEEKAEKGFILRQKLVGYN
ncbi:MAG: hypothetical protein AAB316_01025 [Bacteroidota bacterium]